MKPILLDDVIEKMGADAPQLARKPAEPIFIDELLAELKSSYVAVRDLPCSEIDACMLGLRFETVDRETGKKVVINPNGKPAKIKLNGDSVLAAQSQEQAEALLDTIIKGVIANEASFSVETVWAYSKHHIENQLPFKFVMERGATKLAELAARRAIRPINTQDTFVTYQR